MILALTLLRTREYGMSPYAAGLGKLVCALVLDRLVAEQVDRYPPSGQRHEGQGRRQP
jgi:hypothetical protein